VPTALGNTTLCVLVWALTWRASSMDTANDGSGSTRLPASVLVQLSRTNPRPFTPITFPVMLTVFVSRLTSDQRKPSTSEIRQPVAANTVTTSTRSASSQ